MKEEYEVEHNTIPPAITDIIQTVQALLLRTSIFASEMYIVEHVKIANSSLIKDSCRLGEAASFAGSKIDNNIREPLIALLDLHFLVMKKGFTV